MYVLKIKAAVSFPKPSYNYPCINLITQSNISCIYGYIFTVDSFHAFLRYLFITRYNCSCYNCLVLLKKAAFCGNNCENVGIILRIIILRIIGEFKKNFQKE